jgi:hypothetical protein
MLKHNVEKNCTRDGSLDKDRLNTILRSWEFHQTINSNVDTFVKFFTDKVEKMQGKYAQAVIDRFKSE